VTTGPISEVSSRPCPTVICSVSAFEASLLLLLEPVLNPIWTWLVHGEKPGVWSIAGAAVILLATASSPQTGPGVLTPLSLNELVFHRAFGSPGQTLLESITIQALLGWALAIIGVRTWSGRSLGFSAAFVLLPWAIIYVIWAAIAFK
jgi:drug/metabolite transporter (DMT)-like permease